MLEGSRVINKDVDEHGPLNAHANPKYSPQLATPRRSLFTSNILGQANAHGMLSCE